MRIDELNIVTAQGVKQYKVGNIFNGKKNNFIVVFVLTPQNITHLVATVVKLGVFFQRAYQKKCPKYD